MKLYHYARKENTIMEDGLLSFSKIDNAKLVKIKDLNIKYAALELISEHNSIYYEKLDNGLECIADILFEYTSTYIKDDYQEEKQIIQKTYKILNFSNNPSLILSFN